MRKHKAKEYQIKEAEKVFDGLLSIFNREATEYKLRLLASIKDAELMNGPYDDQFFRGIGFDGFLRMAQREIDSTIESGQMFANEVQAKRLASGEDIDDLMEPA